MWRAVRGSGSWREHRARRGGAYAETGPIFVHPHDCGGYSDTGRQPSAFRHRRQLLRAYDHQGDRVGNTLVEGARAEAELAGRSMFRISRCTPS